MAVNQTAHNILSTLGAVQIERQWASIANLPDFHEKILESGKRRPRRPGNSEHFRRCVQSVLRLCVLAD
jgi:hypothetical protein